MDQFFKLPAAQQVEDFSVIRVASVSRPSQPTLECVR
ncbi:hypothetical protein LINGRAHAP2_LOCUS6863 [Linum grandiflorum]